MIGIFLPASAQQIFQRMAFFAEAGLIDQTTQLAPSQDVDDDAEIDHRLGALVRSRGRRSIRCNLRGKFLTAWHILPS